MANFYYGLLHNLLSALRIGLKLLGITFLKNTCTFIYLIWSCTSSWWDLKRLRGTASIFSLLCPIFATVFFTLYFSALQINLNLLGITFFKKTCTFIYLFILFGLVPLSGRAQTILPARGTAYLFCVLCPIFATLGSTLTFLKSKLVLNSLESIFPRIHAHLFIYLFSFWSCTSSW